MLSLPLLHTILMTLSHLVTPEKNEVQEIRKEKLRPHLLMATCLERVQRGCRDLWPCVEELQASAWASDPRVWLALSESKEKSFREITKCSRTIQMFLLLLWPSLPSSESSYLTVPLPPNFGWGASSVLQTVLWWGLVLPLGWDLLGWQKPWFFVSQE